MLVKIELEIGNIFKTFMHFVTAVFVTMTWLGDQQNMEFESQWVVSVRGRGLSCKLKPQVNMCWLVLCDEYTWWT